MASPLFFWTKPIGQIFTASLWWVFIMAIVFIVPPLRVWWWIVAPILLSIELRKLYFWYMNWDYAYSGTKWVVLEIVPPKEILTPLKAMEDVFTVMWGPLYGPGNWREQWCEGVLDEAAAWMSWEVVSLEGNLHFYLRVTTAHRFSVETILYSHYPELEIREVPDYTKNVPQNLPNEEWDTYGEDFILVKDAPLPIRTYEKFFEPGGEKIQTEEKRLDPIASLLELMSKLGPGEQYWLQFTTMSVDKNDQPDFFEAGEKLIAKLTGKTIKKKVTFFDEIWFTLYHLVMGPLKEGSGEKTSFRWLSSPKEEKEKSPAQMTPGEREKLTEIEGKMAKPIFRTNIRGVYVAKRANWNSSHKTLTRSYFAHFQTTNLNAMKFAKETRPKTTFVYRKRIPLLRARRMFRNYIMRFPPLFPNRKSLMPVLSPEELATLYHFPIKITGLVSPTMARVESKKAGPPPNLPTEE